MNDQVSPVENALAANNYNSAVNPVRTSQTPPSNYLVGAILSTVFCCLPFGIVSVIFAAQVNSKWSTGDFDGARHSSRNAQIWAWVSFGTGLIGFIMAFVFGLFAAILASGFDF